MAFNREKAKAAGWTDQEIDQYLIDRTKAGDVPVDPMAGVSGPERIAAGVGRSVIETGRGLKQIAQEIPRLSDIEERGKVGPTRLEQVRKAYEEQRQLDVPLLETTGGASGNILGAVLQALVPGGAMTRGGKVLSTIGREMIAPRTIPGGMLTGATLSGVQPVTGEERRAENIAVGGLAGGVFPTAARGVSVGRAVIDPLTETGQERILSSLLRRTGGDEATRQKLLSARELVPGSLPTAAQVGESGGLAALERTARAIDPQAYTARDIEQAAARRAALQGIAGTEEELLAAKGARAEITEPLYKTARGKTVVPDTAFIELSKRPAMQQAIKDAENLLKERGLELENASQGDFLQAIKFSLDSAIETAPQKGIEGARLRAINETRKEFNAWTEKKIPEFAEANKAYEELSIPINRMQVGRSLYEKLVPALAEGNLLPREQANRLAEALRSGKVVKQATGMDIPFEQVLAPEQQQTIQNVVADLARKAQAQDLGRGVGSDTVQKLAMSNIMAESGIPTFLQKLYPAQVAGGLVGRAGKALYGDAETEMRQRLARILLDPAETARLMGTSQGSTALIEALRKLQPAAAAAPLMLQGQ